MTSLLHIAAQGAAFGFGCIVGIVFVGVTVSLAHAIASRHFPKREEDDNA